ncbi:MAG: class I SAM-dependent methyltransferase [Anaerolineaceae bacterium]
MKSLSSEQLDQICWQHLSSLPYFRGMLRAVEHSLYARLQLEQPILDIGAGDGHFASAMFTDELTLGIDPWWEPLQEAAGRQVYALLAQAEGNAIPAADASFPCAISNSVLEHIPEVQPVLNEVARVIKPGGVFVFAVPNQRFRTELWGMGVFNGLGLHKIAQKYSQFFNKVARHKNLDDPQIWMKRLRLAGFDEVEYWNYFPKWAMQMLERGHLWGLPNLLWKKTLGKWILFPSRKNPFLHYKKIRVLLDDPFCDDGTCTFYVARRSA